MAFISTNIIRGRSGRAIVGLTGLVVVGGVLRHRSKPAAVPSPPESASAESVAAPLTAESDSATGPDDDVFVAQEEAAAAAEAASIGGRVAPEVDDPAMDPVYQAGGGEEEGFEEAEAELIENATHGDGHGNPERDAFSPEREADRSTAIYGEGDQVPSPEDVEDPDAGSDGPGTR